ncbi:MAG: PAS domain S-box protein [Ignavibacteriaceae bacterium]
MKKHTSQTETGLLRARAEELLKKKPLKPVSQLSETEIVELMHDLEVHQIELELQNEELTLARDKAETAAKKYTELYDFAPSGYFTLSIEGDIIELNINAAKMFGEERSRLINNPLSSFITESTRPLYNAFLENVFLCKTKETCEIALITNSGTQIYVYVEGIAVDNGKQCHINMTDITKSKQSADALKFSNIILRTQQEASIDGILVEDGKGELVSFNNRFVDIWGIPPDVIESKSDERALEAVMDKLESPEEFIRKVKYLYDNRDEVSRDEIILKDGRTFDRYCAPMNSADGEYYGRVWYFRDISERKQTQNEIRDLNASLEIQIEIRTEQLAEINDNLENEIEQHKLAKEALKEALFYSRNLFEINLDPLVTISPEGKITAVNTATEEITGLSRIDLIGSDFIDYTTEREKALTAYKSVFEHGKVIDYPLSIRHTSGRITEVLFNSSIHRNKHGEVIGVFASARDITSLKHTQEKLEQLSMRLALAAQAGGVGIWEFDPVNNLLIWDDQMFRLYGIEKENFDGSYKAWLTVIHPEDKARCDAEVRMAIHGEKEFDTEFSVVFPDGSIRNIRAIAVLQRDSSGLPLRMIGTNWDITVQKQTEALLQQTRLNYQTFFNTIDDFMFVLDLHGNIIHTNNTVTKRLEFSQEELTGQSVLMVHPPERREEAGRIVTEMLAGTADFCPVPLITKSGNFIAVETRVNQGYWDGNPVIFGVSKDVSKIQLSEEKFSKVFYLNPSACGLSDLADGKYVEVNEAFYTLLGFDKDEVIGRTVTELGIMTPETKDYLFHKSDSSGKITNAESVLTTKGGVIKHVLLSAENIILQDKRYRFTVVQDITERKQAEKEIIKARNEAEKANFNKSEFLSRMSHELRTPMNSILGFAQLMNMGELSPTNKKSVNYILKSGMHLLNLINEVLDISRIEARGETHSHEPVQLNGVILEILDILKPIAEKRLQKAVLEPSLTNDLFILANRQHLKQVLLNLLGNALKYNRDGGSVIVKTELRQNEAPHTSSVRISVCDTGLGIKPENIEKLFIPFERFNVDESDTEGTGLGLSIVKRLIDTMGGIVGVESVYGEGSKFWFELPLTEGRIKQNEFNQEITKHEEIPIIKSGTILYIEDNISNIELVEGIIESQRPSIRIISSRNGKLAVNLATDYKPDLIFLDLDLADTHGTKVLANLQADAKTSSIPVIVISADALLQTTEKLLEAGAKDYLTKPIDVLRLLQVVDKWFHPVN